MPPPEAALAELPPPSVLPYGAHPKQYARLHLPYAPRHGRGPFALLVSLHGGFWKAKWTIDAAGGQTPALAADFAARGVAVLDVEYRDRDDGGAWPGANEDVLQCLLRLVPSLWRHGAAIDLRRVVLLGHSAGGSLALWAAHHHNRRAWRSGRGGASAAYLVAHVVAVAPVTDMVAGYEQRLGDEGDAIERFLRTTPAAAGGEEQYRRASPLHLAPLLVREVSLCAAPDDEDVPASHSHSMHEAQPGSRLLTSHVVATTRRCAWAARRTPRSCGSACAHSAPRSPPSGSLRRRQCCCSARRSSRCCARRRVAHPPPPLPCPAGATRAQTQRRRVRMMQRVC